jgi:hypothetical protein
MSAAVGAIGSMYMALAIAEGSEFDVSVDSTAM